MSHERTYSIKSKYTCARLHNFIIAYKYFMRKVELKKELNVKCLGADNHKDIVLFKDENDDEGFNC